MIGRWEGEIVFKHIIHKLQFFIKKISLKESDYNNLIYKAESFDRVMSSIKVDVKTEQMYATSKHNDIILRWDSSREYIINLKVKDILNAVGLSFDKSVKFNVDTNMN